MLKKEIGFISCRHLCLSDQIKSTNKTKPAKEKEVVNDEKQNSSDSEGDNISSLDSPSVIVRAQDSDGVINSPITTGGYQVLLF